MHFPSFPGYYGSENRPRVSACSCPFLCIYSSPPCAFPYDICLSSGRARLCGLLCASAATSCSSPLARCMYSWRTRMAITFHRGRARVSGKSAFDQSSPAQTPRIGRGRVLARSSVIYVHGMHKTGARGLPRVPFVAAEERPIARNARWRVMPGSSACERAPGDSPVHSAVYRSELLAGVPCSPPSMLKG